ncbi:MAG: ribonuclease P protein component [Clostridia bacterium]
MKNTLSIKKKGTFKYLINKGKYLASKHIVVYYILNNRKINNFGICVSKKNGISVHRNKMKRWTREVYKEVEDSFKMNITLVIMFKKSTKLDDLDYYILKDEITSSLYKLGIIDEKNN